MLFYYYVITVMLLRSRYENATPNLCWVFCALLGTCAINKGSFFEIAFVVVVDTHLPRFEALAYVLSHFHELTHVVIRASSKFIIQAFAGVFYSVFVKRSSFKSLLNLPKAYIFQEFAEGLLSICVFWIFQNESKSTELCSSAAVSTWPVMFSAPD